MAIKPFPPEPHHTIRSPAVVESPHGGVYVAELGKGLRYAFHTVRYVCDTAEEAEEVRLLLERHREEVEALMRKRENS